MTSHCFSLAALSLTRVKIDASTGMITVLFRGYTHESVFITSYNLGKEVWVIPDLATWANSMPTSSRCCFWLSDSSLGMNFQQSASH